MIGKMNEKLLESFLETIPVEFSIVDENDEVVCWNRHETRIFKRPPGVVGRNVRNCHPPKSIAMVEQILEEMKAGKRDRAQFWIDLKLDEDAGPQKILIEYYALRDPEGTYLGCLESSRNITGILGITGQKRLLD